MFKFYPFFFLNFKRQRKIKTFKANLTEMVLSLMLPNDAFLINGHQAWRDLNKVKKKAPVVVLKYYHHIAINSLYRACDYFTCFERALSLYLAV